MSEPIIYIDSSEVREGKLEQLKPAMEELARFVEANEPRIIAYNVYLTGDGSRMTVMHIHSDSASLEYHMTVAGPLFPRFAEFIRLLRIDVYGKPTDKLMAQLREKARVLGAEVVAVHGHHAGFARLGTM